MSREHILIVEDEENIQELIIYNLSKEGFRTTGVSTGEDAIRKIKTEPFNLVILDLMLPGMDGLDVCRQIRKNPSTHQTPVIMVTAKGEESDVVSGLELGADDYLTKPFSPKILVARVKNALRRRPLATVDESQPVTIHNLVIHPGRHEVLIGNVPVELTNMEFRVLHFLASQPGWVYTRYQIVDAVRGDNYPVTDRSVDVLIVGLRRKMGEAGALIETVRGIGYRFKEEG